MIFLKQKEAKKLTNPLMHTNKHEFPVPISVHWCSLVVKRLGRVTRRAVASAQRRISDSGDQIVPIGNRSVALVTLSRLHASLI